MTDYKVKYDNHGYLHLFMQDGMYVEEEETAELGLIFVDFTFSGRGLKQEIYFVQIEKIVAEN